MSDFDKNFNFDDVFLRDVTLAFVGQFYRKLRWKTSHDEGDKIVSVPFYYSLKGDNRMMLDAFIDSVTGKRPELNIDPIPRAHVLLKSWNIKTSEFSNPNVNFNTYVETDGILKRVSAKYRPLPIKLDYEIELILDTEIDTFKVTQAIWDMFAFYKYFYLKYKYLRIDAIMTIPEQLDVNIIRELEAITHEDYKTIKLDIEVHTYYPIPPSKRKMTPVNRRVSFRGRTWETKENTKKRTFLGNNINGCEC